MTSKFFLALAGLSFAALATPALAGPDHAGYGQRDYDQGYTENSGIDGNLNSRCPRGYYAQVFPNTNGFRCDAFGPSPQWVNPE